MAQQKYYYKIVQEDLTSMLKLTHKNIRIQYEIDQWVKPKLNRSKLFVYQSKNLFKCYQDKIFKCEVINPMHCDTWLDVWYLHNPAYMELFWTKGIPCKIPNLTKTKPRNRDTVIVCDAVKLIEEVKL